jgi:hypothetical protein
MKQRFFVLGLVAAVLVFPVIAEACAVCLTAAGQNDPLVNAFNWSILFLMAMPYAVLGSIGGWLFYVHRRAARKSKGAGKTVSIRGLAWTIRRVEDE